MNKWAEFHARQQQQQKQKLNTTNDPEGDELHEQSTLDPHGDELSEQYDSVNKIGPDGDELKEQTAASPLNTKPSPY